MKTTDAARPDLLPDQDLRFVLTGPGGTLLGHGSTTDYPSAATAVDALRAGGDPIVVGALAFDPAAPPALFTPQTLTRADRLPHWPTGPLPGVRIGAAEPEPAEHCRRVRVALTALRAPQPALQKVVLARALRLLADAPLDPRAVLSRLAAADPAGYGYLVDLSAAGQPYRGATLVGASPELLVTRTGAAVSCRPFAGSAARSPDPATDRANATALAASGKDHHEHRLVVDAVREVLAPLCTELTVAAEPQLSQTATLWHLSTPVHGRLRTPAPTALELATALHPTPAVGGVPTPAALALIDELEGDRGFYAGAAGWCDAAGDGVWVVSLRGAQLAADGRTAVARSGSGIVAESDPDAEFAETTVKFGAILDALGVPR